jgi:hypothetical protein
MAPPFIRPHVLHLKLLEEANYKVSLILFHIGSVLCMKLE